MKRVTHYYGYFVAFNLCFFTFQLMLHYAENSSFASSINLPARTLLELAFTLCIHIGLYLLLSLVQTLMLDGVLNRSWSAISAEQWQLIIWVLTTSAIVSANHYYFPLSLFSKVLPFPPFIDLIILVASLVFLSLLLINCLLQYPVKALIVVLVVAILCMTQALSDLNNKPQQTKQPNVIILGIDSLSPDRISASSMPFLNQLLQSSTEYTNTISPLARTYPAWSSILTGLYAKNHRAQENLIAKPQIASNKSIAWLLKEQGYNTIYASDDRRFNSIDRDFGFNKVIGPPLGVNDILLGTFNDFPLSNLLINNRLSAWLFPYNYSNRASFIHYYPETFSRLLEHQLGQQPHELPLFLAVHFTLPHWPYAWAESSAQTLDNEFSLERRDELYHQALKRVDQQVEAFYRYLWQNNYLTNSLLIILSDHGEALFYPNSRTTNYSSYQETPPSPLADYFERKTATVLDKSAGHGSDILSPQQYHSLLAFRIYRDGKLISPIKKVATRIALLDIAPTILSFLKIKHKPAMDGISLLTNIDSNRALLERPFYIESGMFPNQSFSKAKTIAIGNLFYKVNAKGQLIIKADKLNDINHQKLYGIIEGHWLLALYPDEGSYIAVIQNTRNHYWSDNLCGSFATKTPANSLLKKLQLFYGPQLSYTLPSCTLRTVPTN